MSACLILIFSDVTFGCCAFHVFGPRCFRLIWRFDDGVWRSVLISYVYMVIYTLYDIPGYIPCYMIICYGYHVRWQAWRFCAAGWLPLS